MTDDERAQAERITAAVTAVTDQISSLDCGAAASVIGIVIGRLIYGVSEIRGHDAGRSMADAIAVRSSGTASLLCSRRDASARSVH